MNRGVLNLLLLLVVASTVVSSFVTPSCGQKQSTALQAEASRRKFIDAAIGTAFVALASPAFAIDDLSMPDEKSQEVSQSLLCCFFIFCCYTASTPLSRLFAESFNLSRLFEYCTYKGEYEQARESLQSYVAEDLLSCGMFLYPNMATSTRLPFSVAVLSHPVALLYDIDFQKAEMDERLRRKAELKEKNAAPKSYQEGIKKEMERKKADKAMTREEKRNALCEELGKLFPPLVELCIFSIRFYHRRLTCFAPPSSLPQVEGAKQNTALDTLIMHCTVVIGILL